MAIPGLESATRYQELIYRLLSEDAEFSVPGFIWESDRPEYSFLKRELRWSTQELLQGAVAAQFGFHQLFNPPGSGRIVVVTGYFFGTTAASRAQLALTTTVRGASGSSFAFALDTRWAPPLGAAATVRDSVNMTVGTAASFGTDIALGQATTGTLAQLPFPTVILAPGTGVVVSDITVNDPIFGYFTGYSRQARPEELAP